MIRSTRDTARPTPTAAALIAPAVAGAGGTFGEVVAGRIEVPKVATMDAAKAVSSE